MRGIKLLREQFTLQKLVNIYNCTNLLNKFLFFFGRKIFRKYLLQKKLFTTEMDVIPHIDALALALAVDKGHDIKQALEHQGINLSAEIAPTKTNKKRKQPDNKKHRIAKLQVSFEKDPRSYVLATATIVDEKHAQWNDTLVKLPKPVRFAIRTPYHEVELNESCRPFLASVPVPHIRHCLNYFYSNRNPHYGTQRKFTTKDSKKTMIDFLLVQEKRINTSVLRNIFRYWLLENENPLLTHFQVV